MGPFNTSCKLFVTTENEHVDEDLCIFPHNTISSLILGDLNCLRLDVISDITLINRSIMKTIFICKGIHKEAPTFPESSVLIMAMCVCVCLCTQ